MFKRIQSKKSRSNSRKFGWLNAITGLRASLLAGFCLLFIGLALFAYQMISTWQDQQTSAGTVPLSEALKSSAVEDGAPYISGTPVHVEVPSVGISLPVIPGGYNPKNNSWTLTLDKAQWGNMTQPANDKHGMTFIYAHYRKGVFLKLPKVKQEEVAQVKTDKGHTFTYVFRSASVTTPTDTSIFAYSGKPILVLQTCTGAKFENRQLFVFDLIKVE